jgi:hypothetical protein
MSHFYEEVAALNRPIDAREDRTHHLDGGP